MYSSLLYINTASFVENYIFKKEDKKKLKARMILHFIVNPILMHRQTS